MLHWQSNRLVVSLSDDPAAYPADWVAAHGDTVFRLQSSIDRGVMFVGIGPEAEACREPINITSRAPAPFDLVSNFARTPFVLDGAVYESVEGFWQGLKFPDEPDRHRLARLSGSAAKQAGFGAPKAERFRFGGEEILAGTFAHWQLMERACTAKFEQDETARRALLATGRRPLVHEVRRDSRVIPGVIMVASIWMRIRSRLEA